ncbi:MAG TPA: hypothetical protein VG167_16795 [Verrucomicrobiae bacterium]|nr:hypothetical protein [Verrucomicrobiae bacterium]
MNESTVVRRSVRWLPQWWTGVLLVAVCWPLNWLLPNSSMRTSYLFFPLWLGYILVVDGLVQSRSGSSLWTRSRADFVLLFLASAPVWWIFELFNQRTANWEYLGANAFTPLQYFLLCTVCFSTVMPAVFETAELVRSFEWVQRLRSGPRLVSTPRLQLGLFTAGGVMVAATLLWPRYCYPFVWSSLVLLLEPINAALGRPHLLIPLGRGDWRPVLSLSLGALICGFFWEMWNFYSYPKWIYHTPGAQFLHLFEMPLLGYGGYIPFALELYEVKNLLWPRSPRLQL